MTPDSPSPPRASASGAAERIATIIEAAERAAAAVVDNADANARRYLEEAQAEADRIVAARLSSLSELTDSLVAQAEEIRRQADRLLESLGHANAQTEAATPSPQGTHLSAVAPPVVAPAPEPVADFVPPESVPEPAPEQPAPVPKPAAAPPPSEPDPEPAEKPSPPADDQATSAGARLLATQMAVSGSSREEIEARLRSGFEIEDTASILDAILGPEA